MAKGLDSVYGTFSLSPNGTRKVRKSKRVIKTRKKSILPFKDPQEMTININPKLKSYCEPIIEFKYPHQAELDNIMSEFQNQTSLRLSDHLRLKRSASHNSLLSGSDFASPKMQNLINAIRKHNHK